MSTTYTLTITMDDTTVNDLLNSGYYLYAYKAVQAANANGGAPLVWFQTQTISENTVITWTESYEAYTSTETSFTDGTVINASASYPINLGQELQVNSVAGTGTIVNSSNTSVISILNQTSTQFTCGISQSVQGSSGSQLCALPLYGNNLDTITPVEQVLVVFQTEQVDTGSVVYQCYAPSLLVNMTGMTAASISYDINTNWSGNTEGWCTQYEAGTDITPILVQQS
ncbi:hypothetical protein JL100_033320 (plasmid) [Skermanella mucosa]|uniref:hypothetical protein n=1 Tax=Skermanella mucosa TaxID=1789672 RepID=UPI00192C6B06|nr:hypothetical protein [Skermanella mucosa]UEM24975.1 hypothetical protein JL100_033320 [Skermanella mucosa]